MVPTHRSSIGASFKPRFMQAAQSCADGGCKRGVFGNDVVEAIELLKNLKRGGRLVQSGHGGQRFLYDGGLEEAALVSAGVRIHFKIGRYLALMT